MFNFVDPVILYQYKSTDRILSMLEGVRDFARSNSKNTLCNFLNIDDATGLWLDQIGGYLNVDRPLIVLPNAFILDSSLMDGTDVLDGTALASDSIYRSFLKVAIARRNSRFTTEDIISNLQFIIGANNIFIQEGVKTVSIWVSVPSQDEELIASILGTLDRKWFGLPSGVSLGTFATFVLPVGSEFFIMDSSPTDNATFLMV